MNETFLEPTIEVDDEGKRLQAIAIENIEISIGEDGKSRLAVEAFPVNIKVKNEYGVETNYILGDNLFNGVPLSISTEHHEIHCGDMFMTTYTTDLTNGGILNILLKVPNPVIAEKLYHFLHDISTELESHIEIYENAIISVNGTTINSFNRFRAHSNLPEVLYYANPTITSVGTLIYSKHLGGGGSSFRFGGGDRGGNEIIFKNNTNYIFRIKNEINNNNYISVESNYYIHPGQ